jgi:hypothetical protein
VVSREHDPELAVDAVHTPCSVAGAQPYVQPVRLVVRIGAARVRGVRGHPGDVVTWDQTLAFVGAVVQQQLGDPGDFRGPELKADRSEGEAERAAQPLRIADAERGG